MNRNLAKTNKTSPRNMPSWLAFAPWAAVLVCLGLAIAVLTVEFGKNKKESAVAATVYLERGAAMIQAYEATLRAGLGFQWTEEELQGVLDTMGTTPSIHYMAVVDEQGYVVAASQLDIVGTYLFSEEQIRNLAPSEQVKGLVEEYKGNNVFLIYRALGDRFQASVTIQSRGRGEMGHHYQGFGIVLRPPGMEQQNLTVFIAYDAEYMQSALAVDARNAQFKGILLVALILVGLLAVLLAVSYRKSRALVRETTAFTYALIDNLPLGIVAVNKDRVITTFNPQAAKITRQDETVVLGRSLAEALPGLWNALGRQLPDSTLAGKEQEVRVYVSEQAWIPLGVTIAPICGEQGELTGQALILRDLGEIRHLQAELRRQDRLAALGSMAAGVAHEIRNPLGAIKGLARYFLESSPADSNEAKMAGLMTSEVIRLDKVVGDLLELSRPDSLNPSLVDLAALLQRVLDMAGPDLTARNILARIEVPEVFPRPILDFDRMTQVLLNLVLNAAQAMPNGGDLALRARLDSAPGLSDAQGALPGQRWLRLEIEDNGIGMDAENLQMIFSPYFTTKAKGTGLGLSLVHKIIEAHQGEIEVKSELGRGTLFILHIPLQLEPPRGI